MSGCVGVVVFGWLCLCVCVVLLLRVCFVFGLCSLCFVLFVLLCFSVLC